MNKKEHKEFKRGWALTVVGIIIAFSANISANGLYDYMHEHWRNSLLIFIISGIITMAAISYLTFFIENSEKLRDKKDSKVLIAWMKSFFIKSKNK